MKEVAKRIRTSSGGEYSRNKHAKVTFDDLKAFLCASRTRSSEFMQVFFLQTMPGKCSAKQAAPGVGSKRSKIIMLG